MKRFLVCHRGALGDFVLTWPGLYALKALFPDLHFLGIGRPEYMRVAVSLGLLDSYHDAESSRMLGFLSGSGLPSELACIEGAVLWLAIGGAKGADLLRESASLPVALIPPFPAERIHGGIYHYDAIRERFPIEPPRPLPPCFPMGVNREGYVLIHPGSGGSRKNYHPPLYKVTADAVRDAGYSEVRFVIGPAEDKNMSRELQGEAIERPEDVEALARLLSSAALFIGNDSGVSHLSGVLGTPTIALYKVTDPEVWGVMGPRVCHIKADDELRCLERIRRCLGNASDSFYPFP